MLKVLIVDDDPTVCAALQILFDGQGLESVTANTPAEALRLLAAQDFGAVVQDMNFSRENTSGEEGVALFRAIKKLEPELPIMLLTSWSSLETAVMLVKEGASDYMAKPWQDEKLLRTVQALVQARTFQQEAARARAQSVRLRRTLAAQYDLRGLIYASQQMHAVANLAATVAGSEAPILITGPNGSGKEKLAEIVQANSRRKDGPFAKVNAGALPDTLLEAELFGVEAGAYTGAIKTRLGRFELAHRGTMFLDEIGNLPLAGQAKLLRVLQSGEFERVGSSETRKVDVRVVSATNMDLRRAVAEGRFREDLFFRLNVIELRVPSLANRPDDILPLVESFLKIMPAREGAPPLQLTESAKAALLQHDWPGNVRELQNRIQRATIVCTDGAITPEHLDFGPVSGGPGSLGGERSPEDDLIDRAELEQALADAGGVVSKAAMELGISRQALYRRMERAGIAPDRRPKA